MLKQMFCLKFTKPQCLIVFYCSAGIFWCLIYLCALAELRYFYILASVLLFVQILARLLKNSNLKFNASLSVAFVGALNLLANRGSGLNQDVLNFEFSKYFDYLNQIAGPYWFYSNFTSYIFGASYSFDSCLILFLNWLNCLLFFSVSFVDMISVLPFGNAEKKRLYIACLFLLSTIFLSLFHAGKGDLLAFAFLNVVFMVLVRLFLVLSHGYCKTYDRFGDQHLFSLFSLGLSFSFLAVAVKTSSAMPLFLFLAVCISLVCKFRGELSLDVKTDLLKILCSVLLLLSLVSCWFSLSPVLQGLDSVESSALVLGSKSSILSNSSFFFSSLSFQGKTLESIPDDQVLKVKVKAFAQIFILLASIVYLFIPRYKKPSHVLALIPDCFYSICILYLFLVIASMPYAGLKVLGNGIWLSTENLRLVAQPFIMLLIFFVARFHPFLRRSDNG